MSESVPTDPHPNQERWQHSDNRVSRKRGGKWLQDVMLPRQQGATRAELRLWSAGGPRRISSGWDERKADWHRLSPGFSWDHKSYFDRVLCQTSPTLITHFQQDHAPPPHPTPSSRNKGQGHQVQRSCVLLGMLPHSLEKFYTQRQVCVSALKCRELQREGAELYRRVPHTQSPSSLRRKIFKRISLETSWRWKGNALGSHPTQSAVAFYKEIRISSHGACENIRCVSTPPSSHKHQPRGHLPVCEFPLWIIEEQTSVQLGKIYGSYRRTVDVPLNMYRHGD